MNTIKLKENEEPPSNFTGIVEHADGTKEWSKEGLLHRLAGPAVEWANGTKEWYKEGLLHRKNGPACEYNDNKTKCWYDEGLLHRLDGPAIEHANGVNEWYIQDECYAPEMLSYLIKTAVYLGTEKGDYNLYWLKFLTEDKGIQEFPVIPGMNENVWFEDLFKSLDKETVAATSQ